jgi:hypothetical protein
VALNECIQRNGSIYAKVFDISADSATPDLERIRVLIPAAKPTTREIPGALQCFHIFKVAERRRPGNG